MAVLKSGQSLDESTAGNKTHSHNEIATRLDNVLHSIYLLFSEGYYSKAQNQILRKALCLEALRLYDQLLLVNYSPALPLTGHLHYTK